MRMCENNVRMEYDDGVFMRDACKPPSLKGAN